jgi:hypothetical protein
MGRCGDMPVASAAGLFGFWTRYWGYDWPCRIRIGPPVRNTSSCCRVPSAKRPRKGYGPYPYLITRDSSTFLGGFAFSFSIENLVIEQCSPLITLLANGGIFPWWQEMFVRWAKHHDGNPEDSYGQLMLVCIPYSHRAHGTMRCAPYIYFYLI